MSLVSLGGLERVKFWMVSRRGERMFSLVLKAAWNSIPPCMASMVLSRSITHTIIYTTSNCQHDKDTECCVMNDMKYCTILMQSRGKIGNLKLWTVLHTKIFRWLNKHTRRSLVKRALWKLKWWLEVKCTFKVCKHTGKANQSMAYIPSSSHDELHNFFSTQWYIMMGKETIIPRDIIVKIPNMHPFM